MNATKLVTLLKASQHAYYETGTPLLTDAEYDARIEELRRIAPNHVFLKQIGPTPSTGKVTLPVPMSSLTKIKPDSVGSWKKKGPFVFSEKLDGISALWCSGPGSLYLRGDGIVGQDVRHIVPHIQGLVRRIGHWIIRGELIAPKNLFPDTLARNWVNGMVHQSSPPKEQLQKIRFVAYQVLEPKGLTRSQQFSWLTNQGFEVAWNRTSASLNELSVAFQERRATSVYTCDGIVVGTDTIPETPTEEDPKDAVAYKEVSEDQCATTTVQAVEWEASKTGAWIPRLRFEPVVIGSATIQYCTAFHAQYVQENRLGVGAIVRIRRSGDVIPIVDAVLTPAKEVQMPSAWEWDATKTHARVLAPEENDTIVAKYLTHTLTALGIEHIRDASTKKLVEKGIRSLADILRTPATTLQTILGSVHGLHLATQTPKAVQTVDSLVLMQAYPGWPRGLGTSKLKALYECEKDPSHWSSYKGSVKGLSADSVVSLADSVPAYLAWLQEVVGLVPRSGVVQTVVQTPKTILGEVVLSGFRDTDLQKRLQDAGYSISETVKKTTKALFVETLEQTTGKVQKAHQYGVPVYPRTNTQGFFTKA